MLWNLVLWLPLCFPPQQTIQVVAGEKGQTLLALKRPRALELFWWVVHDEAADFVRNMECEILFFLRGVMAVHLQTVNAGRDLCLGHRLNAPPLGETENTSQISPMKQSILLVRKLNKSISIIYIIHLSWGLLWCLNKAIIFQIKIFTLKQKIKLTKHETIFLYYILT